MPTPKSDLVRTVPGLEGASERDLRRLAQHVDIASVPAGSILMREGGLGTQAFVIVEGRADVVASGELVTTAGPGSWLGEMALLRQGRRSATVIARTPMTLLVMSRRQFTDLRRHADISRRLTETLLSRVEATTAVPARG